MTASKKYERRCIFVPTNNVELGTWARLKMAAEDKDTTVSALLLNLAEQFLEEHETVTDGS